MYRGPRFLSNYSSLRRGHRGWLRRLRWVVPLALSGFLHWLFLAVAEHGLTGHTLTAPTTQPEPVILTMLIPAPAPQVTPADAAAVQKQQPKPTPKPHRASSRPRLAAVQKKIEETRPTDNAATAEIPSPSPSAPTSDLSSTDLDRPPDEQQVAVLEEPAQSVTTPASRPSDDSASPASEVKPYKTDPPPSARLDYELRYFTKGSITRGGSTISWQVDGNGYKIKGRVTKFGVSLSSFNSEGVLDANGLAPTVYKEKNVRRPETATHFSRDARQSITFSASTTTYPLVPGAQDRASVLWQLAARGRSDHKAFVPDSILGLTVVGVRDAEQWSIRIVGQESIMLENETVQAWHLVRVAQPGTNDKQIDIWLAPAMNFYPVKLRYTEASGDYLDFSMAALHAGPSP